MPLYHILGIIVVVCAIGSIIKNIVGGNPDRWYSIVWAFNCILWVMMSLSLEEKTNQLQAKIDSSSTTLTVICENPLMEGKP